MLPVVAKSFAFSALENKTFIKRKAKLSKDKRKGEGRILLCNQVKKAAISDRWVDSDKLHRFREIVIKKM